jgi:hypothetical protein
VKRFASGPLHGVALALYFLLVPFVVVNKWRAATGLTDGPLVRVLLAGLSVFWLAFFVQVIRQIARLRRGESAGPGGSAWLAGVVVTIAAFLLAPGLAGTHARSPRVETASSRIESSQGPHTPIASLSPMVLAVAARRRRDALREAGENDDDVDSTVALLRRDNPHFLAGVNHMLGRRRDGVVRLVGDYSFLALEDADALCVLVLDDDVDGTVVSFAREGGRLRVPAASTPDEIATGCVAAHRGGTVRLATTEAELLRHLATRSLGSTLVLYDGPPVEAALAERAVLVSRQRSPRATETLVLGEAANPATSRAVRVELLRAEPVVVGLVEPFTATLRRRCVEMVAYLALHRHEPVTGDRLRTRVLAHADADASLRTLANTASSVRRSLGYDERGPRLHPVSSAGLYLTHDVDSDVEEFHRLVAEARASESRALLVEALSLVQGEPLASALRGFEWFLAEGHWARLLREGEWAALALSRWALGDGDVDLAFWAIERGRLLDPYSDALAAALTAVPRLREFGGDGADVAQYGAIGAGRAVVTRGPGGRLGDQVVEQSQKG